ncbi:ribonucleoside-triphosphate reductase, adenosylcobalamin-dependent [Mycobacteroides abscessus]|uniref:ribonucleoside-triphosphate reductase, adenosylcobalamin-dependent n=1 Tax=Mycobacteroides abscessus TaxID=36809 RepID=UPI0009A606FC|nr:ribonucleoside-triphosphate reductase, adenosylcobalamin-dependent [Mycobacteroides abscessus]SLG47541.1 ribonucleoside-diphosphate reductase [Mycobacteroides abscessus subsp. abscessus]
MTYEVNWGPTGEIVYGRTYSRTKPNGEKEQWPETVERVVDGNLALVDERYQLENEREDLIRLMTDFKILPAGRHLWASGVKNAQHLFNCWVSGWTEKPSDHFEFTFMRLMEGGGVGANYSNRFLQHFPLIQHFLQVDIVCDPEHPDYETLKAEGVLSTLYDYEWEGAYPIEDSREGWAAALVDLIDTHYREDTVHFNRVYDVSRIRRAGARLKTFGGRASGPLPLAHMLIEVSKILSDKHGHRLDGMSAMGMDHEIAKCVVAGGVRRSARMAMMHWADEQITEFVNCKNESGKHWTTNISVEVDEDFWRYQNPEEGVPGDVSMLKMLTARNVLYTLSQGAVRNGEPGMWDSSLSNVGEPNQVVCTNPCLTGDTVIATVDGPRTFEDLANHGEDVQVYSWHPETKTPVVRWMRRPHKTASNVEILKVTFDSGLVVRCTPDHSFYTFRGKKVQAKDLMSLRSRSIRAFSASFDGSGHERVHGWDSNRNLANHQYTHRMIWENTHGPIPSGMVIAHLDGDASNNTLENFALMTPYEHASYDYPKRLENGFHNRKELPCANHKVVSVEPAGYADVYNGCVDDSHTYIVLDPDPVTGHLSGIVSANCGEITLEPWEPCNLGHVNLAAFVDEYGNESLYEVYKAHQLMTRFLIRATFAAVGDDKSREVLDRNRRIGVGHLGVASYLAMTDRKYSDAPGDQYFKCQLRSWAAAVDEEAVKFCHQLRIPVPVKKRTVAPTGTIAKMPGVSEGIHPIFSRYFNRRIRFNKRGDDLAQVDELREQGFHVEDDLYAPDTLVVTIPTKDSLVADVEAIYGPERAEELVQSVDELSLNELLAFQAMYQTCWADNAVSFTANVDPDKYTAKDVSEQLVRFAGLIKGATVFPESSMPQSPYERITKEEYEASQAKSVSDGVDEECSNGSCPIR